MKKRERERDRASFERQKVAIARVDHYNFVLGAVRFVSSGPGDRLRQDYKWTFSE